MSERKTGKHPNLGAPYEQPTVTGRIPSRGPFPQSNLPRSDIYSKIRKAFTE